jgi:hypothetical protein
MVLSFAIPWGIDLAASLVLREVEHYQFEHAAVTTGQVVRIEKWQASRGVCRFRYHLHCRFHDDAGNAHETMQILCTDNHGGFPDGLASDVRDALRNRQLPAPIRMAYRVEAPRQTWLADLGPGHGFDLHGFSVQLLFGQRFFMVILIFGPLMTSAERGNAVDWRKGAASIPLSVKEAAPMVIEATWLAFCGFMELILFERIL